MIEPLLKALIESLNEYSNAIIAIFTAATVVIALFELSRMLRGPDIKICEKPEFVLEKIAKDSFNYSIPDRFSFAPTRLVCLNNGPRTGVFKPEIKFNCSKDFRPFFKRHYCFLKIDDKPLAETTYIPIRDQECLIVEVDSYVKFLDWKENFDFKPVKRERIKDVLCQADQHNKQRFSDFCSILKAGVRIGRIDIRSRQTTRGWRFQTVMKEKNHFPNLDGGLIDEELVGNFRSCLKRWEDIEPRKILEEVREVEKVLGKELYTPLETNFRRLMGVEELTSLKYNILANWKKRCEGYETKKAIADFLIQSINLEADFSKYEPEVSKINRMIELNREILSPEVSANVENMRDPLRKETADLMWKVQDLQGILILCIKSNV